MATLDKVHAKEADIARTLLADYRGANGEIILPRQRADRLQQAICEALVEVQK
jgi:hypothetical protein